jgi:hypothetical protein
MSDIPDTPEVPESSSRPRITPLERMAQAFLDPRSIQWMMTIGGSLFVVGMLVYLISWGIFENKYILATTLTASSLAIWGTGVATTTRTRFNLAGRALTFLGCVVLPLNLWFYHAQDILRIDQGLWGPAVICSAIFGVTAWWLKDALFVFAVQAGITLTSLLVMGDYAPAASALHVGILLQLLATLSIHLERAFNPVDEVFSRQRFGGATFWSGHLQLIAGLGIVGAYQLANTATLPVLEPRELFAWINVLRESNTIPTTLVFACLWLWGTYLYLYSRLVVSKQTVFIVMTGLTLVAAEVTIIGRHLSVETHLTIAASLGTLLLAVGRGNRELSITKIGHILAIFAFTSTFIKGSFETSLGDADWFDAGRFALLTILSIAATVITRRDGVSRFYTASTFLLGAITIVAGYRLLALSQAQIFEIAIVTIGTLLTILGCVKRFDDQHETDIREWSGQMWIASLMVTIPLMCAAYSYRFAGGVSLPDDMILATFSLLLLLTGIAWRIKASSIIGCLSLALQLIVVTGSLIYRPDVEMGVYLAIGGGLIFLIGLALSIYRDRLQSLSHQFTHHEGIFQVLDWR